MIVTKRESMASLIHNISPTLRHRLQQSHNKGLYYGFRDTILSRLVTIIKCLVHHAGADPGGALGAEASPPTDIQVLRYHLRIRSFVPTIKRYTIDKT